MKVESSGFNLNWFEFKFDSTLSTEAIFKKPIQLFPNPVTHNFRIKTEGSNRVNEVKIFDMVGRLVKQIMSKNNPYDFNLSELKPGPYFLLIDTDFG